MMGLPKPTVDDVHLHVAGEMFVPQICGALWWPSERVLIVSDLHLEKGSSYARNGQLLPPYDTRSTLATVAQIAANLRPSTLISLGDSFHDPAAEARLSPSDVATIRALTEAYDVVWVEGNHDPDPPAHLGGRAAKQLEVGPITFCHEPTGNPGEIAGHLHPVAKVRARGRSVRRRCFASDGSRLIMPAMGAYTGGLNVCDVAFKDVFPDSLMAFAIGSDRIYALAQEQLAPDGGSGTPWRL